MTLPTPVLLAQEPLGTIEGFGNFVPKEAGGPVNRTGPEQIERIFSTLFGFLTITAGIAFLIYFVIGALGWITAGGDEKKLDDSKKYMTNGIIGLVIIVAAYSIISIVGTVLGFKILNPAETLETLFNSGGTSPQNPGGGGGGGHPAMPI